MRDYKLDVRKCLSEMNPSNLPPIRLAEPPEMQRSEDEPDDGRTTVWALFQDGDGFVCRMFELDGAEMRKTDSCRRFQTERSAMEAMEGSGAWMPRHDADPEHLIGSWL